MEERTESDRHVFGYLREVRATVQDMQEFLDKAQAGANGEDTATALTKAFERSDKVLHGAIERIREIFCKDAGAHEWCSDYVVHIENLWAQVKPPADGTTGVDARAAQTKTLDQIIYQCESLTLSPRVNDILDNLRVGQGVRFVEMFGDELPRDAALQEKLFREIAEQSGVVKRGYVDEEQGVIWRVADTRQQQRWSAVRIVSAAVVGLQLVWAACWLGTTFRLRGWPFSLESAGTSLLNYVFILAGSCAHVLIASIIVSRSRAASLRSPWNDWLLWLNARESQVLMGMVWLLVGFVFLTWTLEELSWQTAFFAGYSIDSVMDVFLDRFDLIAKKQGQRIREETSVSLPS